MAITQPSLGGPTNYLPWPQQENGFQIDWEYRGGVNVMANASLSFDLVATGMKRIITFQWVNISETDRDMVMTRLTSLGTGSATLVTPENDSITVTLDESMTLPRWTAVGAKGNSVMLWTGSVTLREV